MNQPELVLVRFGKEGRATAAVARKAVVHHHLHLTPDRLVALLEKLVQPQGVLATVVVLQIVEHALHRTGVFCQTRDARQKPAISELS